MREVLIISVVGTLLAGGSWAQETVKYPEPPDSPEAYVKLFSDQLDELETLIADDTEGKAPLFSGYLYYAHGKYIADVPLERLIEYVDGLHEAGVQRIDIFTTQNAWPDRDPAVIAKYDALIAHIRKRGLELGFDPTIATTMKGGKFAEWKPWAIAAYTEQARRYQPEKFSVLHEPGAMNVRIGEGVMPEEWAQFAAEACASILAVSPRTQCTAAIVPIRESPTFHALLGIPEIKSIGFDIYSLGPALTEMEKLIPLARAAGKTVHIAETWRRHWGGYLTVGGTEQIGADFDVGHARYAELDHRWLRVMTRYAWAREMEAFMPQWSPTFFGYVKPGENALGGGMDFRRAVFEGLASGHRTETFYVFKRLIEQYKAR